MMYGYWDFWPLYGIFWAVIWIVFSRIGWRNRGERWRRGTDKSALDILKERYAKGEINKAEFEEKKRDIV